MKSTNEKGALFAKLAAPRGLKTKIAEALKLERTVINNWKTRGVPSAYAHAVAAILKCKPEEISDVHPSSLSVAPLSQKQSVSQATVDDGDMKGKVKQAIRELMSARPEDVDGFDILAVQDFLAQLQRRAVASFTPESHPDKKK